MVSAPTQMYLRKQELELQDETEQPAEVSRSQVE